MKKLLILFLLIFGIVFFSGCGQEPADTDSESYYKAVVKKIITEDETGSDSSFHEGYQLFEAVILEGEYKNVSFEIENYSTGNMAYDLWVKEGQKVLLIKDTMFYGDTVPDKPAFYLADFYRQDSMLLLFILFLAAVLLTGRMSGLRSLAGLAVTILTVVYILVPKVLDGSSPVLWAILSGIIITTATLLIVAGADRKAAAAIAGTCGGLATAALLTLVFGHMGSFTGLGSEDANLLVSLSVEYTINFKGILFAGIIIGALGAVMDVSISVASSIMEIAKAGDRLSTGELFAAGMNVGKDIIGTMTNTLILAYAGASLPTILLLTVYRQDLSKIINLEMIADEILRSLAGSIGLISAIPITAFVAAVLFGTGRKKYLEELE